MFDTPLCLAFPVVLLALAYCSAPTVNEHGQPRVTFAPLLEARFPAALGRSHRQVHAANSKTIFQVMMSFDLFDWKWWA